MDNLEQQANTTVGTALDTETIEQVSEVVNSIPAIGIRLNFSNGTTMKFEFMAEGSAKDLAAEINSHLQDKVELLGVKDENGKRGFKASDVLPKRKCTIDIVQHGVLVKSSLMGAPIEPNRIFTKDGKFFEALLEVLIRQTTKRIEAAKAKNLQLIA